MDATSFQNGERALHERFACCLKRVAQDDLQVSVCAVDLGVVQVAMLTHPPIETMWSTQVRLHSDLGTQLCLMFSGCCEAEREGPHVVASVTVQLPRGSLPLRPESLDRLLSIPPALRTGLDTLFSRFLVELIKGAGDLTPADMATLAGVTLDMSAATCARRLRADVPVPPDSRQPALLTQIREYIQHRLGDRTLSPDTIAAAHQISTRYLHKLFKTEGTTVAAWIRQRRLEQCRRDLADPRLRSRPIQAISARWGFADGAHFSRLFRATYGIPPRDYRELAQQSPGVHLSAGSKQPDE